MSGPDEELWVDEAAGPVVRPFAVARGRTRHSSRQKLDLIAVVVTAEVPMPDPRTLSPEDEAILELCLHPLTVADVAAALTLPLGVIRVLLGDLADQGLIDVRQPAVQALPDHSLLKEVIDGLRAL
ncbi:DUF742 domain-containing protein [Spirillospora sp. NPDC047279]|uniref:DUF742 domain-containing protein n=1 Tax=Spirillospora sp. NPDC047279 TaxID=3155478 RepID=UPI0033F8DCA3